jgi:hypothetical protein
MVGLNLVENPGEKSQQLGEDWRPGIYESPSIHPSLPQ